MYNVLLVDDESMVRIGVRTCVDWKSLEIDEVYEASNGAEALEIIRHNKVDIVITDIKMSVMDGFSMLDELRQMQQEPEVIVMSCYNDYENMRQAMTYGVKDFLFKPKMYPADIEDAIRKVQGELTEKAEGLEQKIREVMDEIGKNTYLEQFRKMYDLFEQHNPEIQEAIQYLIRFQNHIMSLDDTSEPVLHIFSTVLFRNLYEIRQCEKMSKLLSVMNSVLERTEREQTQKIKEEMFRALQYIDFHLADVDLSQEQVAEHIGLSGSYFSRLFKQEIGTSYSSYIIKKRIELAEKLYKTTNMKVYEIAKAVGYTNEKYFARLYKEQTGHSMREIEKTE